MQVRQEPRVLGDAAARGGVRASATPATSRQGPKGARRGEPAGEPRALVVAPTRELALQIFAVCGKLRRSAPVRCVSVYGGASQEEQEEQLAQPSGLALLVVGTPGRAGRRAGERALRLRRARMLVIDEADRMLALRFAEQLEALREALPGNERDDETLRSDPATPGVMGSRPGRQTLLLDVSQNGARARGEGVAGARASDRQDRDARLAASAREEVALRQRRGRRPLPASCLLAPRSSRAMSRLCPAHVCAEGGKRKSANSVEVFLFCFFFFIFGFGRARTSTPTVFANRIKFLNFVGETLLCTAKHGGVPHGELKQEKGVPRSRRALGRRRACGSRSASPAAGARYHPRVARQQRHTPGRSTPSTSSTYSAPSRSRSTRMARPLVLTRRRRTW